MGSPDKPDRNKWEDFQRARRQHIEKRELKATNKYLIAKAQVTRRKN